MERLKHVASSVFCVHVLKAAVVAVVFSCKGELFSAVATQQLPIKLSILFARL